MADAQFPNDEPVTPVYGDDEVVWHEDWQLLVRDVVDSHCAVSVLIRLLRGDASEGVAEVDMTGLAVLLEMVQAKLGCSVEGLSVMGRALHMPG